MFCKLFLITIYQVHSKLVSLNCKTNRLIWIKLSVGQTPSGHKNHWLHLLLCDSVYPWCTGHRTLWIVMMNRLTSPKICHSIDKEYFWKWSHNHLHQVTSKLTWKSWHILQCGFCLALLLQNRNFYLCNIVQQR